MAAKDEEMTKAPLTGSVWVHTETKGEYSIEGTRKIKYDGVWYDGVDYQALSDQEKYWRTFKDFYKNFTEKP